MWWGLERPLLSCRSETGQDNFTVTRYAIFPEDNQKKGRVKRDRKADASHSELCWLKVFSAYCGTGRKESWPLLPRYCRHKLILWIHSTVISSTLSLQLNSQIQLKQVSNHIKCCHILAHAVICVYFSRLDHGLACTNLFFTLSSSLVSLLLKCPPFVTYNLAKFVFSTQVQTTRN